MSDMDSWTRTAPLSPRHDSGWTTERWIRGQTSCDVDVLRGKPFDVVGLKGTDLNETREYAAELAQTALALYDGTESRIDECIVCGSDVRGAARPPALTVFGIVYGRCGTCGHVFVASRPADERLNAVFADSESLSGAYTDPAVAERRIADIIQPKLAWVKDVWERTGHTTTIGTGADIGAGGGHFVEGMRRDGIDATGFELSRASQAFAKQAFDIDLRGDDVLVAEDVSGLDLVTMWGLLEYTPDPRPFITAADRMLADDGLLVVEVPRVDAISTTVQTVDGAVVARHMDPTSHVNCFTDASLATLLVNGGFIPVAAWYFGMDAYEMLTQAAVRLGDPGVIDTLAEWIPHLQATLDAGSVCDDLVIAAVKAI